MERALVGRRLNGLHCEGGIVRREMTHALRDSQAVTEHARRRIADMSRRLRERARRLRAAATRAAEFEAGLQHARWMLAAQSRRDHQLQQTQASLVQVALHAVRQIVTSFDDVALAVAAVESSLDVFRESAVVTIWVHPELFGAIEGRKEALSRRCPSLRILRIERDTTLAPTACRLSCELGVVLLDARDQIQSIEEAIGAVLDELEAGEPAPAQSVEDAIVAPSNVNESASADTHFL